MNGWLSEIDRHESELENRLREHRVFHGVLRSKRRIIELLEQRRFLSLEFTRIYDVLIDAVAHEGAKGVIREIIKEEYSNGASHRERLVHDICLMGTTPLSVLRCRPTRATVKSVVALNRMVYSILNHREPTLPALAFIRFWGEALTGIEYEMYWGQWLKHHMASDTGGALPRSEFYWFHFEHDKREAPLARDVTERQNRHRGLNHADQLSAYLVSYVTSERQCDAVKQIDDIALNLKLDFYNQFLPKQQAPLPGAGATFS
jgi:hypothetical protein